MKFEGLGLFVKDMKAMVCFYRDVLGFDVEWDGLQPDAGVRKDGVLLMFYGRKNFEQMTSRTYGYAEGINGHFEIALAAETYSDVDRIYETVVKKGAEPILKPTTEPWGQHTCYIADPEGNLIEIGSFNVG
ncbi:MAG: VOC family protein [Spirochaetia bacterium]|jgi:catechol 2,3-dioxygenase-like lactoylglutathione lyase family enzyme|nr:VOC family protein [Spirochaetia bacterium]